MLSSILFIFNRLFYNYIFYNLDHIFKLSQNMFAQYYFWLIVRQSVHFLLCQILEKILSFELNRSKNYRKCNTSAVAKQRIDNVFVNKISITDDILFNTHFLFENNSIKFFSILVYYRVHCLKNMMDSNQLQEKNSKSKF